jgi:hypothetical protein
MIWWLLPTYIVWMLYSLRVTVFSLLSAFYRTKKASCRHNPPIVNLVIVTVANRSVRDALEEVIE